MATSSKSSADDIRTSTGNVLKTFVNTERRFQECMTIELIGCNPIGGDSFTEASITTQVKLSTFPCSVDVRNKEETSAILGFETVFDMDKLENFIGTIDKNESNYESGPEGKKRKTIATELEAFQALDEYCSKFDYHQKCLKKVLASPANPKPSESDVVKVLNTHLFQPLSGGTCYINNHILKDNNLQCSCGCNKLVKQGHTGIGSEITWHGHVDMLVKGTIPIAVMEEVEERNLELTVEVKRETEAFQVNRQGTSQLIAQTITNAFAQSNQKPSLSGIPVPAFGCTSAEVFIYAYDCENDVLLKKLPITGGMSIYQRSTSIMLWLYINFMLFMRKDVTDLDVHPKLHDFTSNFNASQSVLAFYQRVESEVAGFVHNTN